MTLLLVLWGHELRLIQLHVAATAIGQTLEVIES